MVANADGSTGASSALASQIDSLLADTSIRGSIQGMTVQSLTDGKVWYEHNADLLFLPASNEKLLTSAAALAELGPDWKYDTILLRDGGLDDTGTLHGNLYLVGSGDPLLADKDLDEMVDQVKAAGIRKIVGRIVGDDSRFDRQRYGDGWSWDDLPYNYSAQVGALNLDENVLTLTIDPGKRPGDPVRVGVTPTDKYAKLVVRARTVEAGSKSSIQVGRELGTNEIIVDGTLAVDAPPTDHRPASVTVEDPARFAAFYLMDRLESEGIEVTGGVAEAEAPRSVTSEVARHTSQPLSAMLRKLNKPSDNLIAECFLKTLAAQRSKYAPGSFSSGIDAVTTWLKSVGLESGSLELTDGSGLSTQDYVTPRSLATLLRIMKAHPHGALWIDSLPIAGVDGTLRSRMKGTAAENNCRAKTGSHTHVSSLSGYVSTKDGEPLVFSILMNNLHANHGAAAVEDRIVELLAGWQKMSTAH